MLNLNELLVVADEMLNDVFCYSLFLVHYCRKKVVANYFLIFTERHGFHFLAYNFFQSAKAALCVTSYLTRIL